MPAPLALSPLAWTAIRLGAVAAVALYAARKGDGHPKDLARESVLDDVPEGVSATPHCAGDEGAVHGAGRFRRVVRFGPKGPGVEIDVSALGRVRLRRLE